MMRSVSHRDICHSLTSFVKVETKSIKAKTPTHYPILPRQISPGLDYEAPPCSQSQAYFREFPDFPFDPSQSSMPQLVQLGGQQHWDGKRAAKEKRRLRDAYIADFQCYYGIDANNIESWRALFRALRIEPAPSNVRLCEKVS
jgi:hypothetical protein